MRSTREPSSCDVARDRPVFETRDILRDCRGKFGAPPEAGVQAVALFTDNDDTGEPVSGYYGTVALQCGGAGA